MQTKLQHTCKDGVLIPYPLIRQNPHRWRMCASLAHNKQRCVPQSWLSYDQSSSNKAWLNKPIWLNLLIRSNKRMLQSKKVRDRLSLIIWTHLMWRKYQGALLPKIMMPKVACRLPRISNRHGALWVCQERKSANSNVLIARSLRKKG